MDISNCGNMKHKAEKNKMNILVVCQYYFPEEFRINDICEQLVSNGHQVTVITGLPNYPTGVIPNEYRKGRRRKENIKGVNIIRCFEVPRRNNTIGLALNYMSYAISSSLKVISFNKNYDIVFCYQLSPVFMALPAIIYKKLRDKPLLLYCCDLWPESLKSIIRDENTIVYKFAKKISSKIYGECDHIAITSKPFSGYIKNLNNKIEEKIISYIPQHADDMYLKMDFTVEDNDCVDFMFLGNVGQAQDLDCLIEAVEFIKDINNFKVHIVGDGSYLNDFKRIVREKKLEGKFIFYGRHPVDKMPEFYKIADSCLLTLKHENFTGMTVPSKLQGYMAAGKPVIGAINGAAQDIIKESECGLCVNASDAKGLSQVMLEFISNKSKYISCGQKGRKFFEENFTKDIFIAHLEELLNEMVIGY